MSKIKNMMSKMSKDVKELIKKFPVSMLIIVFVTIMFTVTFEQDFSRNVKEVLEKIYIFSIIWAIGTLFTETFFKKKLRRIISYIITAGISFSFVWILSSDNISEAIAYGAYKILTTYIITLVLLTIYKSIKNAELKFEEYCLRVLRDLFNTTTIYIILNIGILILTAIFVELILDGEGYDILPRLLMLLLGLYYIPSFIYTISSVNKREVGSFIKGLVIYVLLPLTIIAMAIIYIYIAKIIILRDMPQNIIYRILAGIFIAAFPIWNMASNYSENNKFVGKVVKLLPYLYAPFILLEIYSIGVRISEYGVTPSRYIACVFIVFQIIALALTFYKNKQKILYLFIVTAALTFIILLTPLGFDNISNLSQKNVIENIMPKNQQFINLSNEDKKRVQSAYYYLKYQANSDKYIPDYLTEADKKEIEGYNKYITEKESNKYIYLNKDLELNIQEYENIYYVEGDKEDNGYNINLRNSNEKIDLKDFVIELIKNNEISDKQVEQYFEENNVVKINETQDIFISYIYVRYYENSESIKDIEIEGYLLEKQSVIQGII